MDDEVRRLGSGRADAVWTYVVLGGGAALLLGLAPWLAALLAGLSFVPFSDVVDWVGSFDAPWTWVGRPVAGLAVGCAAAAWTLREEYRLEVGPEHVVVAHGPDRRRIERSAVVGVHRDGKRVVIDGREGRRLFSERVEASRDRVREAFAAHGYPYESE